MTFVEKLKERWQKANTMVCVGLDTDKNFVPLSTGYLEDPVLVFNKAIIDATKEFVCAYKLNFSFYALSGWLESILVDTIEYIHKKTTVPVILDSKFGDISYSSENYARIAFERFKADAVTVNPYFGQDALQPFLERADKGVIILCKTSNPGAGEFQDMLVKVRGQRLFFYQYVALRVAKEWNKNGNCLLVVGGTYPEAVGEVRDIVGDLPILVPGIGIQGGDLEKVVKYGLDSKGYGLIIAPSRSIIYASTGPDFAEAAARCTKKLCEEINQIKLDKISSFC